MNLGESPRSQRSERFDSESRVRAMRPAEWVALARRRGPSPAAEAALRSAFERALASAPDGNETITVGLGVPFTAWFEYLVTFGRFAEAQAARDRVMPLLGRSFFAKPRHPNRKLVEALAARATPDIFQRGLAAETLASFAALARCDPSDLLVTRHEAPLPSGVPGSFEAISVALPVPVFTGEPLWIAFARLVGGPPPLQSLRVFTLDWFSEEWLARPAAWSNRSYLGPREYGPDLAAGAAPRPNLGAASPYMPLFLAFIGVQLKNALLEASPELAVAASASPPRAPYVPASFPPSLLRAPVPSMAPRSWPPPPGAPKRSRAGRILALVMLAILLAAGAVAGGFALWRLRLRPSHH